MQYSESGKPVLLGVFTGSFSSLSGEHSLFVRTSSVISHGFLPIDELDLFFNDINIDNNNNREGEANRAEMQMEKETLVNREQARSNESLIEEAMPTTEADSDEGGSGGNKKKKKEEGGPTAMAIVSYMGLGFIALVMTAACIIVNIFDRRT